MRSIALDMGGTKTSAALVEGSSLLDRRQIATPRIDTPMALVDAVADLISGWDGVLVAMACTGWVSDGRLKPVNPANIASGIATETPIRQMLSAKVGLPVFAINDAQAAAWGEFRFGAGRNARSMLFMTVSTGVGGGLVIDGKLQTGPRGFAGHVGHMVVDPSGPLCGCGRRGCLEAIASGRALEVAGSYSIGTPMSARGLFALRETSQAARDIVDHSAAAVATAIGNLVATLDLDCVVIGGGVGLAEGYIPLINRHLEQLPALFRVALHPAVLAGDAALLGAPDYAHLVRASP